MSTLQTTNLTRRFGTMTAVDDLTLRVEAGEVFGLLGPNGAGKSTAIKMLTTLLAPTAGSAQVAGYDIQRQASEVRRVIGYVPQALSTDGTLTGYENLLFFASNAIYPIALMPAWLRVVASVNPLSYQVDALRTLMLAGGAITWGTGLDIGVLLVVATALIVIGARVYPQLVQ